PRRSFRDPHCADRHAARKRLAVAGFTGKATTFACQEFRGRVEHMPGKRKTATGSNLTHRGGRHHCTDTHATRVFRPPVVVRPAGPFGRVRTARAGAERGSAAAPVPTRRNPRSGSP